MTQRLPVRTIFIALVVLIPFTIYISPIAAAWIYAGVSFLAPVWLPLLLASIAWPLWTRFTRSQFVMSIPYSLIELKPGVETPRSARAMELVFYSLYHRTDISSYAHIFLGQVRLPWSFEIHAHAGVIRFFVYMPTAHRAALEARLRAEYRDIDINPATDYSREFHFDPVRSRLQVREYSLAKPDPYPLKTYVEHEKTDQHRDVFNEMLEELVTIGENEHVFISWIVRPHQRERKTIFDKPTDTLHEDAHREIANLLGPRGDLTASSVSSQATIASIEAALKKPSFDCGIRSLYVADRRHFSGERADNLDHLFDRFGDSTLNSIRPYDPREQVEWPTSDILAVVSSLRMQYFMQMYRRRAYFAPPYYGRAFVLNAEELATVFHVPHIARVSALSKMRGFRLEPPENLPV